MSVLRQLNVLGQQRLDVPHIRSIESAVAADFDVLAGRVQGGGKPLVIRGFTLSNYSAGTNATSIQLNTADGIIYNMNASEAGTFLWVPADRTVETLNSSTNSRVQGSFTAGQTNYIGLDLVRTADDTTSDLVQFLDPNTLLEQPKSVPLARTLDYRILISTTPFSASSNIIPIAKVVTDTQNQVASATNSVQDARNVMWRLGSGGDFPSTYNTFSWAQTRLEYDPNVGALSGLDKFSGGDKGITNQKDWMDAVMTRLWEVGGGQNWYSPVADRNFKMTKAPGVVFTSTADNFEWVAGLYASTHLHWQGLKIVFENANVSGVYYNTVADQPSDDPAGSAALSKTALAIGDCIYVDIDRTSNANIIAKKAAMQTLGSPTIPGSRIILAWRDTSGFVFVRDTSFPVNTSFAPATTVAIGAVRLSYAAGTPATPTVPPLDANNAVTIGGGSYTISGNNYGLTVTGGGTFAGIRAVGGGSNGDGLRAEGVGSGAGVRGIGGATAPSNYATRASGAGGNYTGGVAGANGVVGQGGSGSTIGASVLGYSNVGLLGIGTGSGAGVAGVSSASNGTYGVTGEGSDGVNAGGVSGTGKGTGLGGSFTGGSSGGGISATGFGSAAGGVFLNSGGSGNGVTATAGGSTANQGIGGDFMGGGSYGVRAQVAGALFAQHAILAIGGSGGSYGVRATGGDINAFTSSDDATFNVGYGAGGVFVGGQVYGGVGMAGFGGGTTVGHTPSTAAPDGQGGYFVGVASTTGSADGLLAKGGAGTTSTAGNGVTAYGGGGTALAGGVGGRFKGGNTTGAGVGGRGISVTAGNSATATGGIGADVAGGNGSGTTASPGGIGLNVVGGTANGTGADANSVGGNGIVAAGGPATGTNSRGGHGGIFTGGTGNPNSSPYQVGGHGVIGVGAASSKPGIGVIGLAAGMTVASHTEVFNETPQGAGVYGKSNNASYYAGYFLTTADTGTALYAAGNSGANSYGAAAYFSGGGYGTGSGQRNAVTIYQLNPTLNPAYACLGTANGSYGIDATGNAIPIAMGSRTSDPSGLGTLLEGSFWLDRATLKINCVMNGVIRRTVALT